MDIVHDAAATEAEDTVAKDESVPQSEGSLSDDDALELGAQADGTSPAKRARPSRYVPPCVSDVRLHHAPLLSHGRLYVVPIGMTSAQLAVRSARKSVRPLPRCSRC